MSQVLEIIKKKMERKSQTSPSKKINKKPKTPQMHTDTPGGRANSNIDIKSSASRVPKPICPVSQPNRKLIEWDDNNNPVAVTKRKHTIESIKQAAVSAASAIYTEADDFLVARPEFYGMTYMEVALLKLARMAARGDKDALNALLDRTIGKPKQTIESTKLNITYQDFLDGLSKKENIIDVKSNLTLDKIPVSILESDTPPEGQGEVKETIIDI